MKQNLNEAEQFLLFEYKMRIGGTIEYVRDGKRYRVMGCKMVTTKESTYPIMVELETIGWVSMDVIQWGETFQPRTLKDLNIEEARTIARSMCFEVYMKASKWHREEQKPARKKFAEGFRPMEFYLKSKGTESWFTFNYEMDYITVHREVNEPGEGDPYEEVPIDMEEHHYVLQYLLSLGIKPKWYDNVKS